MLKKNSKNRRTRTIVVECIFMVWERNEPEENILGITTKGDG
jgi:hypothetical protein